MNVTENWLFWVWFTSSLCSLIIYLSSAKSLALSSAASRACAHEGDGGATRASLNAYFIYMPGGVPEGEGLSLVNAQEVRV